MDERRPREIPGPQRDDDGFSGCDVTMIDDFRVVTRVMTTDSRAVTRPAKDGIAVLDGRTWQTSSAWKLEWRMCFGGHGGRISQILEIWPTYGQLSRSGATASLSSHTDKNKRRILSYGTILVQIYLDTTILTRTTKVDLVLCTQPKGVTTKI